MTANVVVRHQVESPLKAWNTDLFDCCQDMNTCCYAYWCCPCFACSTTRDFGESPCLPLLDLLGPACMIAFEVPICAPPASLALRVAIRHKYGIQGSICGDLMVSCFCMTCSWCQMAREIQEHNKSYTIINAQPAAVSSQPQAMAPQVFMTNQQNFVMASPQFPNMATNPHVMASPQFPNMATNPHVLTSPQFPNMATSPHVMTADPLTTTSDRPPPYHPQAGYGASALPFPDMSQQIMKY